MIKAVFVGILCGVLFGCAKLGPFVSENRQNISRLEYGMTKEEVHGVMGRKTVRSYNNPYRTAMHRKTPGEVTEVFYYWTDGTFIDGIQDYELTPVVFSNGRVIGWGREFFSEYTQKYEVRIKSN